MGVSVYQIKYSDEVVGTFDAAFSIYDCRHNPEPEKREIAHMLTFYDEGEWKRRGSEHFGLVSPKFSSKTGITGKVLIDWIEGNPGYDVYFVNPFPQLGYWHFNVWTQGEYWHPGLAALANALFEAAGLAVRVEDLPRNTSSSLLYSNYWFGNEEFWGMYMAFVQKLVSAVDNLKSEDRETLYKLAPYHDSAPYFPFVFERLFSTFLVLHGNFTCLPYFYERDEILSRCANDMERFIIREWAEMIDNWDSSGRNDAEYRKLFANIQGMLRLYQSVASLQSDSRPGIYRRFIDKIKHVLGLIRPIKVSCH